MKPRSAPDVLWPNTIARPSVRCFLVPRILLSSDAQKSRTRTRETKTQFRSSFFCPHKIFAVGEASPLCFFLCLKRNVSSSSTFSACPKAPCLKPGNGALGKRDPRMGVSAYWRVAPIASTSLLFLMRTNRPLRRHAHTPIRVPYRASLRDEVKTGFQMSTRR
jgi:hypothetical protein